MEDGGQVDGGAAPAVTTVSDVAMELPSLESAFGEEEGEAGAVGPIAFRAGTPEVSNRSPLPAYIHPPYMRIY